jgi:hypothetical protein
MDMKRSIGQPAMNDLDVFKLELHPSNRHRRWTERRRSVRRCD